MKTDDINSNVDGAVKNLSNAKTKFCLSLHYNDDSSYLFVNLKKIYKCKPDNKK